VSITYLNSETVGYIREFTGTEPKKPFTKAYTFVKNDMKVTRYGFKEIYDEICTYMNNLGINYGILLTMEGTFVFTEKKVDFNPLMVKLATGINFGKQVNNINEELGMINVHLGR
jgi:hypothetical protein